MKKRKEIFYNLIVFILILSILFLVVFVMYLTHKELYPELSQGEPAKIFCSEKCENDDLIFSNNNSKYNFIRCECVEDVKIDAGYYSVKSKLETRILYFDSETYEEIDKNLVLKRIISNS